MLLCSGIRLPVQFAYGLLSFIYYLRRTYGVIHVKQLIGTDRFLMFNDFRFRAQFGFESTIFSVYFFNQMVTLEMILATDYHNDVSNLVNFSNALFEFLLQIRMV